MRYLEDLTAGELLECGSFTLSRSEIITFAHRFDPQPFHTNDEAAKSSLFGRLTASSLHSAAASRQLVMQAVLRDLSFVGSRGAKLVRMHQPVFPDSTVRVTHAIEHVEWLDDWPGIGQVASVTRGIDVDGNLLMTIESHDWVSSRARQKDFTGLAFRRLKDAPAEILAPSSVGRATPGEKHAQQPARLYFEDCDAGSVFTSSEYVVSARDIADFQAEFDPILATQDRPPLVNEWHGTCLGTRLAVNAFWMHSELAGGTGMNLLRWPMGVAVGDRLQAEVRIVGARSSQTRPKVGLIEVLATCTNQRFEVVSSYSTTAFIWKRTPEDHPGPGSRPGYTTHPATQQPI